MSEELCRCIIGLLAKYGFLNLELVKLGAFILLVRQVDVIAKIFDFLFLDVSLGCQLPKITHFFEYLFFS